jgi:hypothetical protein
MAQETAEVLEKAAQRALAKKLALESDLAKETARQWAEKTDWKKE